MCCCDIAIGSILDDVYKWLPLVVAAWVFVFVFKQMSPVVKLRVTARSVDEERTILRIEVENVSRVRVHKEFIRFQTLEHARESQQHLSEWVPFQKKDIRTGEAPMDWFDPIEVFESSAYIYPGETIAIERLYKVKQLGALLHVGLQFRARLKWHWLSRGVLKYAEQWTTTLFVDPKALAQSKPINPENA